MNQEPTKDQSVEPVPATPTPNVPLSNAAPFIAAAEAVGNSPTPSDTENKTVSTSPTEEIGRFGVPLQPLQPAIRTFKSDIAEALKGPKASLAKIAIAEQEKARLAQQPKAKAKPFVVPTVAVPMTPSPNVDPSISHNMQNANDGRTGAGATPVAAMLNQEPQQDPSNKGPLPKAQQPPPELPAMPKKISIPSTPGVKTFVVPQAAILTPEEEILETKGYPWLSALSYVFASLLLIVGGGYGAWYMYTHSIVSKISSPTVPQPQIHRYPSTITTDTQQAVSITSAEPEKIRSAITEAFRLHKGAVNEVFGLIPLNESSQQMLATDIIPYVFESIPGSVSRSMGDPYTIGGIVKPLGNSAFIVWHPSYFQGSLAGFLDWETTLPQEAHNLFPHSLEYQINFFNFLPKVVENQTTSSTVAIGTTNTTPSTVAITQPIVATTSPTIETTDTLRRSTSAQWRDMIYKNKDLRILRNQAGDIIMLYLFIDTQTVIITDTLDTFDEILRRYEKTSYKR